MSGLLAVVAFSADSFFQLRLGKVPTSCSEEIVSSLHLKTNQCDSFLLKSSERSLKLEQITAAVVKELKLSCSECGPEVIDNQLFDCYPESPSFLTYRGRLEGTSERDSLSLVSLIEEWVRGGETSLIVTGVLMTLDPHCSVSISSLDQPQCSPPPSAGSISDEESVPSAIIGGVATVVVVLIIALTIAIVTIIVLILKSRREDVSLKNNNSHKK